MIFSSFNQFNCFVVFVFLGIIFSFIFSFLKIILLLKKQKNFKKIIFESVFYSIFAIFFVFFLNFFNFGKFFPALILACWIGFWGLKKSTNKTVVFLEQKWYNTLTKLKDQRKKLNATQRKKS